MLILLFVNNDSLIIIVHINLKGYYFNPNCPINLQFKSFSLEIVKTE